MEQTEKRAELVNCVLFFPKTLRCGSEFGSTHLLRPLHSHHQAAFPPPPASWFQQQSPRKGRSHESQALSPRSGGGKAAD